MDDFKKGKKFYITTAIDYVNGKPHIGHALEKIQADVLARYRRAKGDEVFFLTGTDVHGIKNFRAAEAAGKSPADFTEANTALFKDLKKILNLSWDDFIVTSDKVRHWPGVQKLWNELLEKDALYKKDYQGFYCVGCEAFITEKELVKNKCPIHQREPEKIKQENWFFRLPRYAKEIESKIKSGELKIIPESRRNEILSFIGSGLEDVSFSRPKVYLSWGIPVPNDPEQVMYVWCDALSNYVTAIGYGQQTVDGERPTTYNLQPATFEKWWPADVQVIGKDILRFHAAIWPGMLLAAGLPLPKMLFVHGFITVEGEKMSKTIGNVVDPVDLVKKYGIDAVRYYFLREIPAYEDGDFSIKKFEERYNGDLANGLGNLVARVAAIGEKMGEINFRGEQDIFPEIKNEIKALRVDYDNFLRQIKLNEALGRIWNTISLADKFFNDNKPWAIKEKEKLIPVIANAGFLIWQIADLLEPFLPETSGKIRKQVEFVGSKLAFRKKEHLFNRLG